MTATTPTVGDFMTPEPCAISESLTLADAADRMAANNIRHLLVLRDELVVGVASLADLSLANAVDGHEATRTPVSMAARRVYAVPPDAPITTVARDMEAEHYDCAVVVDADGMAVGIFTTTDALRALRQLAFGHEVERATTPTHRVPLSREREHVLPLVRVRRLLAEHHADPSPNDGKVFGGPIDAASR